MLGNDGIKYRGKNGITDEQARTIYETGVIAEWAPGQSEVVVNYKRCPYVVTTSETLKGRTVVTVRRAG